MIEVAFKSFNALLILRYLTSTPNSERYQAEIATSLHIPSQTTSRVLKDLSSLGLVIENKKRGKLVFYKINIEHPLIKALLPLFDDWDAIDKYMEERKSS